MSNVRNHFNINSTNDNHHSGCWSIDCIVNERRFLREWIRDIQQRKALFRMKNRSIAFWLDILHSHFRLSNQRTKNRFWSETWRWEIDRCISIHFPWTHIPSISIHLAHNQSIDQYITSLRSSNMSISTSISRGKLRSQIPGIVSKITESFVSDWLWLMESFSVSQLFVVDISQTTFCGFLHHSSSSLLNASLRVKL
jgi:hypothetical protein